MAKIDSGGSVRIPRRRRRFVALRRAARRLELRSVGLIPEHFNPMEGYRAAVAVAVPLAVAAATARADFGWAVFAAFWTCLCDGPGPDRLHRRVLAIFVAGGALIALAGSWLASLSPAAGMAVGPLLVFLAILGGAKIRHSGLLGTLLAVVGVVAVGFPHPFEMALIQAGAFLGGAAWAYLLINWLWPIDPLLPLSRASDAVIVRLWDMADSLVTLGAKPHRDQRWHSEYAEHRRAVRLSIERLRVGLERYQSESGSVAPFQRALAAAETLFGALIALDQAFIDREGLARERLALARSYSRALLTWRLARRGRTLDMAAIHSSLARANRLRGHVTGAVFIGCARALETALSTLAAPAGTASASSDAGFDAGLAPSPQRPSAAALRQALRQSLGLIAVYGAALALKLGYPYWAAMAVVVVLQGGARVTWARCLERILGSLLGGGIALIVLHAVGAPTFLWALAVMLGAAAIALRSVNYTIFVVFLTMLFVIVTEMLEPGGGIASARMLDNVIGSLAALLAVFLLWPDFGASLNERIRDGIAANRRYFDAVEAARPIAEIEAAKRQAGLASVEAEVALHDLGGILHRLRPPEPGPATLKELRHIAGQAAIAWHRRLGIDTSAATSGP
ncbi:FUSC family protein [Jiella sp. MQZ9-1]|uniref:FUSC family protein n=1 Tax=Jiella flava TaxID=2816857 RepID=A0A939FWR5_9HYPH|nr:FUSC family protein [Jiella flava]MBO0662274.1 FUSC family protein [Jiella flava]MCD2470895.1 FUSC family protein [Jiella flava]